MEEKYSSENTWKHGKRIYKIVFLDFVHCLHYK
jgi:hypothetical protein